MYVIYVMYDTGEEAIERVAAGLGGRVVVPEVLKYAELYYTRSEWTYRRAAVVAVTRLAEGCPQYFSKNCLPLAKGFLLKALQDPSPVVRFEVLQVHRVV